MAEVAMSAAADPMKMEMREWPLAANVRVAS
jgi:hypothetical protein